MKGLIAFFVSAIAICAQAQNIKQPKNGFDLHPFDVTQGKLPIGYKGHDCRSIAAKIKKINLKKDDLETTAEYDLRMSSVSNLALTSSLTAGDLVAFKRGGYLEPNVKYLADDRLLYVEAKPMTHRMVVGENILTWDNINIFSNKDKNYRAANAYGTTVTVTRTDIETCAVAFTNITRGPLDTINVVVSDAPVELARRAKAGVSFFYIGKLEKPFVATVYETRTPKINDPFEVNWRGDALVVKLMHAWVVENKTGEILGTQDF